MSVHNGWMRTEYDFDLPAVCMRVECSEWMEYFNSETVLLSDDPEELSKQSRTFIENKYPFLSGCVIFYVRYDVWQRMLEIGVAHERFKRVPIGQSFPKVRVFSSEDSGLILGKDECRIEDVLRVGAIKEWGESQYPLMTIKIPSFEFNTDPNTIDKTVMRPYVNNAPKTYVKVESSNKDSGMKVASETLGNHIHPNTVGQENDDEDVQPTVVQSTE